jgi:DnaJ like chaperone protein
VICSSKLSNRFAFAGWVGVVLLFAGIACALKMAQLENAALDPQHEPKEHTRAAITAMVEYQYPLARQRAAIAPYRDWLLTVGGGLVAIILIVPLVRLRVKRAILLTVLIGIFGLVGISLAGPSENVLWMGCVLAGGGWYVHEWIVCRIGWKRPRFRGTIPLTEEAKAEFEKHIAAGDAYGMIMAAWAKFAKMDGTVSKMELAVVERWMKAMRFDNGRRLKAIATFQEAKAGPATFCETALELRGWSAESFKGLICVFIFGLFDLAYADGEMSFSTEDLLRDVCELHGAPFAKWRDNYHTLKATELGIEDFVASLLGLEPQANPEAMSNSSSTEHAYAILGCDVGDSDEVIRERYRKLAKTFHPDTLASKDLPSELVQLAAEKFRVVQQAYEAIQAERAKMSRV